MFLQTFIQNYVNSLNSYLSYELQGLHKIRSHQFCEFCLYASNAYLSFWIHSDLSLDFALISQSSYLMMHKKIMQQKLIMCYLSKSTHYLLEIYVSSLSISKYIYFYYLLLFTSSSFLLCSFFPFLPFVLRSSYGGILTSYPLINDIHLLKNNIYIYGLLKICYKHLLHINVILPVSHSRKSKANTEILDTKIQFPREGKIQRDVFIFLMS